MPSDAPLISLPLSLSQIKTLLSAFDPFPTCLLSIFPSAAFGFTLNLS
jgi:hypothetical protein